MTHALRLYFPPAVVQRGKRMDSAFAGAWTGALPKAVLQFSFPVFAPLLAFTFFSASTASTASLVLSLGASSKVRVVCLRSPVP